MTAQTPGQAAYEEWKRRFDANLLEDWDEDLADSERGGWESIAQAGTDARVAAVVRVADTGTVVVAFRQPVTSEEGEELHERWAEYGPDTVSLVIVGDVAAVAVREPAPAPGFARWLADQGDALGDGTYTAFDMAAAYGAGQDDPLTVQPADDVKPAPELAAAMREARGYREALEQVRAIILEGDNSTEGSRLRRSRSVIRAALEGR